MAVLLPAKQSVCAADLRATSPLLLWTGAWPVQQAAACCAALAQHLWPARGPGVAQAAAVVRGVAAALRAAAAAACVDCAAHNCHEHHQHRGYTAQYHYHHRPGCYHHCCCHCRCRCRCLRYHCCCCCCCSFGPYACCCQRARLQEGLQGACSWHASMYCHRTQTPLPQLPALAVHARIHDRGQCACQSCSVWGQVEDNVLFRVKS